MTISKNCVFARRSLGPIELSHSDKHFYVTDKTGRTFTVQNAYVSKRIQNLPPELLEIVTNSGYFVVGKLENPKNPRDYDYSVRFSERLRGGGNGESSESKESKDNDESSKAADTSGDVASSSAHTSGENAASRSTHSSDNNGGRHVAELARDVCEAYRDARAQNWVGAAEKSLDVAQDIMNVAQDVGAPFIESRAEAVTGGYAANSDVGFQ